MSETPPREFAPETTDDLTRRHWLLRLGEMVALAGVSGMVPEAAAALLGATQASGQHRVTTLPPGLYEPSADHLVHALSSAGKRFAPPPGSETDYVQISSGPFRPQFFSAEEFRVVSRFVEIVLGDVDPGALSQAAEWLDLWLHAAAGVREAAQQLDPLHRVLAVAYFGEEEVRALETSDPQAIARSGIAVMKELSVQQHGKPFLELAKSEQIRLIESTGAAKADSPARKFFDLLRGEAIRGYFTSAKGLEELDYQGNAYYSDCPGCEGKS